MAVILVGAAILSWPEEIHFTALWPALSILGACLRGHRQQSDAKSVADRRDLDCLDQGARAGAVNLTLAIGLGAHLPPIRDGGGVWSSATAMEPGFDSFVIALGAILEPPAQAHGFLGGPIPGGRAGGRDGDAITPQLLAAGTPMAFGVWLPERTA